jgi:protein-disulfide isomerase
MPKKAESKSEKVVSFKIPNFDLQNMKYTPILMALLVIASFLLGVLATKVAYLENSNSGQNQQAAAVQASPGASVAPGAKVNVSSGPFPVLGDKNAKVTVVEFADFQCPFCEQWFTNVETPLIKDYVNTGKIKFAFRNYAFLGQESTWAAEAAYCANDQGKFWDYHDYLYKHQGQENSGAFSKANLEQFAADLGLNTTQFNSCLDSDKYATQVANDVKDGQTAGVTGTPTSFVDGQSVVGAQPYSAFKTLIDQELAKAK